MATSADRSIHYAAVDVSERQAEVPAEKIQRDDNTLTLTHDSNYSNNPHPQQSHPPNTADHPLRHVRTYRDNFSDSICTGLFADPYDRSSCCALTCCGTFLQDRNQYLVTGEMPPQWWQRLLGGMGALILVPFIVMLILKIPILFTWIAVFIAYGVYATNKRQMLRRLIMQVYLRDTGSSPSHLDGCGCDRPRKAHRMCSWIEIDHVNAFRQVPQEEAFDPIAADQAADFCAALWRVLAGLCFGCCGCWFNCWGVCATAQEHRELRKRLPKEKFEMDYITMQPFSEYYPAIQDLRIRMAESFWVHLRTISSLSRWILGLFGVFLALIATVILVHSSFPVAHYVVVLATMGQALLVLYLVYWQKHRFDLSLDAVIKLFGVGFLFSTGIAMIVELITGLIGGMVMFVVLVVEIGEDGPNSLPSEDSSNPNSTQEIIQTLAKRHFWTFATFVAFQAFIVAGMTEEFSKYFCFWMVEHPDFPDQREDNGQALYEKGLRSTAAAITAGMVATASGFACSENFLYVFGGGLSLSSEIKLLLLRSCFPVHPICAAIQSIGICRRDVEQDQTVGLGQALLPAVLLHGVFDFTLMIISMLDVIYQDLPDDSIATVAPTDPSASKEIELPSFAEFLVSIAIVVAGLAYYFISGQHQRERLCALEQRFVSLPQSQNDLV